MLNLPDQVRLESDLKEMFQMQRVHNEEVHPKWDSQTDFVFTRAIWVECGEALDHWGWKWWKHQERDLKQVVLELVDIWHFALSYYLVRDYSERELALELLAQAEKMSDLGFVDAIEQVASNALATRFVALPFMQAATAAELTYGKFRLMYMAKNALNIFRQNSGYKEGTYGKIWSGLEDNEVLDEIVQDLISGDQVSFGNVLDKLHERYRQAQAKQVA